MIDIELLATCPLKALEVFTSLIFDSQKSTTVVNENCFNDMGRLPKVFRELHADGARKPIIKNNIQFRI